MKEKFYIIKKEHIIRKATLQEIQTIAHTLTDEEILDVCKQYYPVGTRFKSALNDSAPYIGLTGKTPYLEVVDNVKVVFNGLGIGFLYHQRNGFAEIISSPKEETFVLPERWGIKVTKESKPFIRKYRESINYKPYDIPDEYQYQNKNCGGDIVSGTELTLEQFKKYVLKESQIDFVKFVDNRDTVFSDTISTHAREIHLPLLTHKECYTEDVIEVGDTVEMISNNPIDGFGEVEIGDRGIVTSIGTNRYIIDFPNHSEWAGLASELKLIKKASKSIFVSKPVKSSNKLELIPIKVRNVSTFVTPKRIKTTITKPKLIY